MPATPPADTAADRSALPDGYDGEHADAMTALLARIPLAWGRWLRCGPGWYGLLADLDRAIAAIEPDYVAEQVKEKYGTLRFYWDMPDIDPACCTARETTDPRPLPGAVPAHLAPKDRTAADQSAMDAWWARATAHLDSPEHAAGMETVMALCEAQQPARTRIDALVEAAEQASAHICELCGNDTDARVRARGGWRKTLCEACAARYAYPTTDAAGTETR